jgi:hypothetical protein
LHAISKYLRTFAEPEIALAGAVSGGYERSLVVPACRENASMLDGYTEAAASSRGRTLCIVVVNGREDAPRDHHAENAAFLCALLEMATERIGPRAYFGTVSPELDVAVVDRASEGARFPAKTGVGLARKIGMDLALALHVSGKSRSPFIFGTDADATLPSAHFDRPEVTERGSAGAVVFPFWHDEADDPAVTRATALYELSLRYYVAGLAFAGSPYAFHTLGSATAVSALSYASVRGAPRKREAGEDFYLLGKIAKVAPVLRASGAVVRLRSRSSDRTPFGTGAGVARELASGERLFYAPGCFDALARFLARIDACAEHASVVRLRSDRGGLGLDEWDAVATPIFGSGGLETFDAASRQASSPAARRARLHEWFDAFRTLKFIHALRNRVFPSIPWAEALARAPFAKITGGGTSSSFVAERRSFAEHESATPNAFGPASFAAARSDPPSDG